MIRYEIEGGNLPVVTCYPQAGQSLCTEGGAMSWMSPNMNMQTNTGGGLGKVFGRLLSGESIFMNEYTAEGGPGEIAFSSSFPGSIIPFEVTPGNGIIVQKGGFLAMEKGLELSVYLQKRLGSGLFGGEGFIMQKITGSGVVFVEIDGHCKVRDLGVGESLIVDTGYVAAMTESCSMEIQMIKGVKNVLFGSEGLFNTRITGPGRVFLQSLPIIKTAEALAPYLQTSSSGSSSSSSNSGGAIDIDGDGIKLNLGKLFN